MIARVLLLTLLLAGAGCVWQPIAYDADARADTEAALAAFRENDLLAEYFAEAAGYAVLPSALRAGTGLGGALGSGWLFEGGGVTGKVLLVEFFAGVDLGAQVYRSIIFFRTPEALQRFRNSQIEFTGQANASVLTAGASITPAYSEDVAMFVEVRGGLLLEASVGGQHYEFLPLAPESPN
mgnify:CR=1 FL=1